METNSWLYRRGSLARDSWEAVVDDQLPGWSHAGMRVAELVAGSSLCLEPTAVERIVVPLAGTFVIEFETPSESGTITLLGRRSVFHGPTDVAYLPTGSALTITGEGHLAIAEAATKVQHPVTVLSRESVPVEIRGAGRASRQVHNFGTPGNLLAEKLIVCEVITPSENWSSYPAHKHDESRPGHESRLEEIYYFEARPTAGTVAPEAEPFGIFATYSSAGGEIDTNALVHDRDIALVPFGYHGPAAAAPGYDLYYLNVMAGPDSERTWLISDDPSQAWVRDGWQDQPVDPRLPFGPTEKSTP